MSLRRRAVAVLCLALAVYVLLVWNTTPSVQKHKLELQLLTSEEDEAPKQEMRVSTQFSFYSLYDFEPPLLEELHQVLTKVADGDKRVMMSYLSEGYLNYLPSFLKFARASRVRNLFFCALDEATKDALREWKESFVDCSVYRKAFPATSFYRSVCLTKPLVGLRVLEMGFNVMITDLDVFFLRNPFDGLKGGNDTPDVEISVDYWFEREKFTASTQGNFDQVTYNAGLYMLHSNSRTLQLSRQFFDGSQEDPEYDDQSRFIGLLNKNVKSKIFFDEVERKEVIRNYEESAEKIGITLRVLPYCEYTMGGSYSHGYCKHPYSVHVSGVGKKWASVEAGLLQEEMPPEEREHIFLSQPYEEVTTAAQFDDLEKDLLATLQIAREGNFRIFLRPYPCSLHVEEKKLGRKICTFDFFYNGDRIQAAFTVPYPWMTQYFPAYYNDYQYFGRHVLTFLEVSPLSNMQGKCTLTMGIDRFHSTVTCGAKVSSQAIVRVLREVSEQAEYVRHIVLENFPIEHYIGDEDPAKEEEYQKLIYLNLQPAWCRFGHDWKKYEEAGWAVPGHAYTEDENIRYR